MTPFRYDYRIDLAVDNAHSRVLRLVGTGKRVLELGCATGYMTKVLVEQFGCTVVGVDRDAEAAEQARKVGGQVVVGDIDALDLARALGDGPFDVILCADVLEHLRDPARTLAALRPLLAPDGYVVASIPNIGHIAVIAELLEGRFPYGPHGLLDETHLRLFTRHSVYETFERAGFVVSHLERLQVEPAATEFRTDLSRYSAELAQLLRSDEDSTTYQFVLTASPAPSGATIDALRDAVTGAYPLAGRASRIEASPHARFDAARALFEAFLGRMKFLEAERDRGARELQDARGLIDHLRREIAGHVNHVRHLEGRISQREGEVSQREGEISAREERTHQETQAFRNRVQLLEGQVSALQGRLTEIETSRAWHAVVLLRRWRVKALSRVT